MGQPSRSHIRELTNGSYEGTPDADDVEQTR